jgi:hypothetical protein
MSFARKPSPEFALARRDMLLTALTACAELLSRPQAWEAVVPGVLRILGEAIDI